MTSGAAPGNRELPTGELRFDGNPVSIELSHETCQYMVSGEAGKMEICYNLGNLPLIATDKGIILGEIKEALKTGRKVTANANGLGETYFEKVGPVVLGFSGPERDATLQSVGRFGLSKVLGLKKDMTK